MKPPVLHGMRCNNSNGLDVVVGYVHSRAHESSMIALGRARVKDIPYTFGEI